MSPDTPFTRTAAHRSPFHAEARWARLAHDHLQGPLQPPEIRKVAQQARLALERAVGPLTAEAFTHPAYVDLDTHARDKARETVLLCGHHFINVLRGDAPSNPKVVAAFRALGRKHGRSGRSLEPLRQVTFRGSERAWEVIHQVACARGVSADYLGHLGQGLFVYIDYLDAAADQGFRHGRTLRVETERIAALSELRGNLVEILIDTDPDRDADLTRLKLLAAAANWPLPEEIVVIRARGVISADALPSHANVLTHHRGGSTLLLCSSAYCDLILQSLHAVPQCLVAVAGPVSALDVAHANQQARKVLDLIELGVLEKRPITQCSDHQLTLWIHAESSNGRAVADALLEPLLEQPTRTRLALAQTMLAWLQARQSAPAIAAQLGVHPQTVRYRLRAIHRIFGERLNDPDHLFALTLALKRTLPLWSKAQGAMRASK